MKKQLTLFALMLCQSAYTQYCILPGQTPYSPLQPGITGFQLNTISRTSGNSESTGSVVVVTGLATTVIPGQTYTMSISHSEDTQFFPGARNNLRIWIDYNNNFSFSDVGETALAVDLEPPGTTYAGTITIPLTVQPGTIAMRVTAKMSADAGHSLPTPCNVPADPLGYHGEMEDYLLIVEATGEVPLSDFSTSSATICTVESLSVTNTSTGNPSPTYSWSASPAAGVTFSPSSTGTNPTVHFSATGTFTIKCTATNSVGSSSSAKQVTVQACNAAGITKIAGSREKLFPNPASTIVVLTNTGAGQLKISVTALSGSVVMEKELNDPSGEIKIDISSLPEGFYFITAEHENGIFRYPMVICR